MEREKNRMTKKDIERLSCFFYNDASSLPATAFAHLPLRTKRHSVQVGVVAGLMAKYAPHSAIPAGMSLDEYANAVRYGSLYHDIGAFLVYNQTSLYPLAGERFLREQICTGRAEVTPEACIVMLETVRCCMERYDGTGGPDGLSGAQIPLHAALCAIADAVDSLQSQKAQRVRTRVLAESGAAFSPAAVECFSAACAEITLLYKAWRDCPPFWNHSDIKPLERAIQQSIG